jgi:hypothetical protein
MILCLIAAACMPFSRALERDLSQTATYASAIGTEYRSTTVLYAEGVYRNMARRELGWVYVTPVKQTGPEIAFHRTIPVGQVFRVAGVHKYFVPFENGLEFVVTTEGLDLPPGIEIVIELHGLMPSTDGFPDRTRFEKVDPPRLVR